MGRIQAGRAQTLELTFISLGFCFPALHRFLLVSRKSIYFPIVMSWLRHHLFPIPLHAPYPAIVATARDASLVNSKQLSIEVPR